MPLDAVEVKWPTRGATPGHGLSAEDRLAGHLVAGAFRPMPERGLQAVLFDLDGVLVDTAECHYQAWQKLADELGLPFSRAHNEAFRGVGRMECLESLLGDHNRQFALEEKRFLAERKNSYYTSLIATLTPADVAPGAHALALDLRAAGVRLAVVSASRNAPMVIRLLGITHWFDAIIDGSMTTRSKPDPEGFLLAARRIGARPEQCVVIEDAEAGIRAATAAHMASVGIAPPRSAALQSADLTAAAVGELTADTLVTLIARRTTSGRQAAAVRGVSAA